MPVMRVAIQVSIFLSVTVLWSLCASAFGPAGHQLVGAVAEYHLCDDARREIDLLLDGETLGRAGRWPDWIRSRSEWKHTRPWHYINVGDREPIETVAGENVLFAIDRFRRRLADATLSSNDRAEALRFLTHFIADVHQPLHVGRLGDRGGNEIAVRLNNKRTNLHAVWDAQFLLRQAARNYEGDQQVRALVALTGRRVEELQADRPVDWARESQALRPKVYAFGTPAADSDLVLSEVYLDRALDLLNLRLAEAGVRLAGELNDIFCGP